MAGERNRNTWNTVIEVLHKILIDKGSADLKGACVFLDGSG